MKERPIIFSGPMVRAILEGRKTQTRRVVKPQPLHMGGGEWIMNGSCPYGPVRTRLWVRETWGADPISRATSIDGDELELPGERFVAYKADGPFEGMRWRPSIHMPRWASRIMLEVTDVRVERVQDIGEEDARAEGVDDDSVTMWTGIGPMPHRAAFSTLWDSINAKRGYGWDSNPWVWVVSFRVLEP